MRIKAPLPVVEWSPQGIRVFDPRTNSVTAVDTLDNLRESFGSDIILALSRRCSFIRNTRLPDANKAEVAKVLALQIGTLFPMPPNETAYDFYLSSDQNAEGRLAVVCAVPSQTLTQALEACKESGLTVQGVVPAALGSSLLAHAESLGDGAILEIVPEGLAIDVIQNGEVKSSRIAPFVNSTQANQEIERAFALSEVESSERVLVGSLNGVDNSRHLTESSLARLSGLPLPIRLELPETISNRAKIEERRHQRVAIWLWIATIVLGIAVWDFRSQALGEVQKADKKWNSILTTLRSEKDLAETKRSELTKVDRALKLGYEPKQHMAEVLSILTSLTPEGVWLTGMTLERGKVATLRGTSLTGDGVTTLLKNIEEQSRFRQVKLIFANNAEMDDKTVVQFSISYVVVGNLPLDTEVLK